MFVSTRLLKVANSTYKTKQNSSRICSCYSGVCIAQDHMHTDITICNIKINQQKYRIGTVSNILLGVCGGRGGGDRGWPLTGFTISKPRPLLLQRFETFGPHKGYCYPSMNQNRRQKYRYKPYGESEMTTRQRQSIVTP